MKFMMFEHEGSARLGVVDGDSLIDIVASDDAAPKTLQALIGAGAEQFALVAKAVETALDKAKHALGQVKPALPLPRPGKFVCVGLNYALHAKEGGHELPEYPSLFVRWPTSLLAAEAPIIRPKVSDQLDYEGELAFVIGQGGRHIPETDALAHVFGYTIFNDVSVRAFQRKTSQWTPGKNFDATGPLGPVVATPDELPPGASGLRITTRVNGETRQDSNTSDMIFPVARTIAILSEFMTLEAGDVIATGTPSGVAHAMSPPGWMRHGDKVEVEIEGIGVLRNRVIDET